MPTKTAVKTAVKKVIQSTPKKAVVAKKTVKKTTTKPPKKVTNFKALVCASDGECFWTRDGRILQNLEDLHMAFGSMDEEVFVHHVHNDKNDFADWVEQVLGDLDCSVELRKAKELKNAHTVLFSHMKKYSGA